MSVDAANKLKILADIPLINISEIKKSPRVGFQEAKDHETGAYITSYGEVVGVMLTREQYEGLIEKATR